MLWEGEADTNLMVSDHEHHEILWDSGYDCWGSEDNFPHFPHHWHIIAACLTIVNNCHKHLWDTFIRDAASCIHITHSINTLKATLTHLILNSFLLFEKNLKALACERVEIIFATVDILNLMLAEHSCCEVWSDTVFMLFMVSLFLIIRNIHFQHQNKTQHSCLETEKKLRIVDWAEITFLFHSCFLIL